MSKRTINVMDYANTITESLIKGIFLTTKAGDKINSMVIGWGHLGRIWERPVFIAYVRDCRYTYEMIEKNPEFTLAPVAKYMTKVFGQEIVFIPSVEEMGSYVEKLQDGQIALLENIRYYKAE